MFRWLPQIAMLSIAVSPGIATAQLAMVTDDAPMRHDYPVDGTSDPTLDELVRRLDAQEQELSYLRQVIGTGSTIAPCLPNDGVDGPNGTGNSQTKAVSELKVECNFRTRNEESAVL